MIQFIIANKVLILGAMLAISEVLGAVPQVAANGFFDAIVKALKFLKGSPAPELK